MTAPVSFFFDVDTPGDDHGEAVVDQGAQQGRGAGRVVSVIAIDGDEDVGIDLTHHAAHDAALALPRLRADNRSGGGGYGASAVLRVVVVDIYFRMRQGGPEVFDNGGDGSLLITAGDENGEPQPGREWLQIFAHSGGIFFIG